MVLFKKRSTICLGIAVAAIVLCGTFIICHVARVKSTKNVTACNASSASDVPQASADISEEDMDSLMKNNRKNPSENNVSTADNAPANSSKSSSSTSQATAKNTTSKAPAQPASTEQPKKTNQSKSPQKYVSAKFGISIDFPASWQGKYKVLESDNELHVIFKPVSHPVERGGVLFSIIKRTPDLYEGMYDTVGKRYVTNAKGVVFLIGGPTDVGFPTDNPEYGAYRQLASERASVVNTIKSIH